MTTPPGGYPPYGPPGNNDPQGQPGGWPAPGSGSGPSGYSDAPHPASEQPNQQFGQEPTSGANPYSQQQPPETPNQYDPSNGGYPAPNDGGFAPTAADGGYLPPPGGGGYPPTGFDGGYPPPPGFPQPGFGGYYPPPKKSNTALIVVIIIVAVVVLLGGVIGGVMILTHSGKSDASDGSGTPKASLETFLKAEKKDDVTAAKKVSCSSFSHEVIPTRGALNDMSWKISNEKKVSSTKYTYDVALKHVDPGPITGQRRIPVPEIDLTATVVKENSKWLVCDFGSQRSDDYSTDDYSTDDLGDYSDDYGDDYGDYPTDYGDDYGTDDGLGDYGDIPHYNTVAPPTF